jgi:integrase
MPRRPSLQITRDHRTDGSTTYARRVRAAGTDQRVPLGNTSDGWDEIRAEHARKQLLAKIELGQWPPTPTAALTRSEAEPTFRELATEWLEARRINPEIRARTIQFNETQLKRYLAPFFGELRPSEIDARTIKAYRQQIHTENDQIRKAAEVGIPLRDPRTRQPKRTLSNDSINQSLRTLALILDEAEDAGWIERNPARGKRTREPATRRRHQGVLDVDEFLDLLDAAAQLDQVHRPTTLEKAESVRALRDRARMSWKAIGQRIGVAATTAIYLYGCTNDPAGLNWSPRRAIIATLGLSGLRVGELCALDFHDIDLAKGRLYISDSKTDAGVRTVDIHPRLLDELRAYRAGDPVARADGPVFPTRDSTRRTRANIRGHVIQSAVRQANKLRTARGEPPIRAHVTPHTFRRTYISYMVAAGYDIPYIQAQVGHRDPSTTLAIYARVIARPDRDEVRDEIRHLFGVNAQAEAEPSPAHRTAAVTRLRGSSLRAEKAGKGRILRP